MREWLTILQPKTMADASGAEATTWNATKDIHAERVKLSGRRSEEVAEHFPDYNVQFRIRDVHKIDENWRVQHKGGYLYTVVAIEPNIERGFKTLICERVNE